MADQKEEHNVDEEQNQQQKDADVHEETITEVMDADDQVETEEGDTETKAENSSSLQAQLDKEKQEKEEMHQQVLRVQAEFDNFKKRTQKEKEANQKYKAEEMVQDLLPVMDNFERALQVDVNEETKSFADGITMVYRQLKEALAKHGVEEMETVGKSFDPNIHHAVMQVEDDEAESETVVEEMQKGYYLKDRVIRPAMVKVNK
ncbi:nucleotide exchange factor GrpE [Lentibacillus halophilus]|uniref:Protein GrpE n=1 Tax=Lentibacillus halophilus TaxID=295065 RepID=A0ABN0ZC37_9BACI